MTRLARLRFTAATVLTGALLSLTTALASSPNLAAVCPSPLVVQTDWHPKPELGALYHLLGEGAEFDVEARAVRGRWLLGGADLGVELEIRAGGPAIGFQNPRAAMLSDDAIHLAVTDLDRMVDRFEFFPVVAVLALLEKSPFGVLWDGETLPGVERLSDLRDRNVPLLVYSAFDAWVAFMVAEGTLTEGQIDPSYDGTENAFLSETLAGRPVAQFGSALSEPHRYQQLPGYARRPAFRLLADEGYPAYAQTVVVLADRLDELSACLTEVVPLIQGAMVAYLAAPERANATIVEAVTRFADGGLEDAASSAFAAAAMREQGFMGNGSDGVAGSFDLGRLQGLIDALVAIDGEGRIPVDLSAAMMVTHEFLDPTVRFGD